MAQSVLRASPPSSSTPPPVSLSAPILAVKGVGEKRGAALQQADVQTVEDLLYYVPRQYLDRRHLIPIGRLAPDTVATVLGTVRQTTVRYGKPGRFELMVGDETGLLRCVWFGDKWMRGLRNTFTPGDTLIVSGKVTFYNGKQIISPEYDILTGEGDDPLHTGRVIPVYPSSAELREVGLDSRGFRRIIKPLLDGLVGAIPETLPPDVIVTCRLPALGQALYRAHFPETPEDAERARERLAFDELFYMEMILALRKQAVMSGQQGIMFRSKSPLARQLVDRLPFDLTPAQKRVIREIHADMCRPYPMNRLLQGDVGSGKTIVAVLAMLLAVESGYQAALMAPTEILAEQHYLVIHDLLDGLGVTPTFLVGGLTARERVRRHDDVANGTVQIVIGTHALIQEDVAFHRLGLVVIDEQHRFGVVQRAALRAKGEMPDVLVMTATPIPRTLALTVYGDLDISVLDALPPGRKPITTTWISDAKRKEVYDFVRSQVEQGRQIYVVCPLVDESEKVDLKAAIAMAEHLQQETFSDLRVALLHGRMKGDEKDAIMHQFKAGGFDILVSTTVIEVGIDVPNATVMVIEQAERFGLAQLHQLRGRVGRGEHQSSCILINGIDPGKPIPDDTLRRLEVMTETQDGFRIADEDLKLRGPGEFLGTRQHGLPGLRIADVLRDQSLLLVARREAFRVVEYDGRLAHPEHRVVQDVLTRRYTDGVGLIEVG